jgi:hypothetical protein
VSGSAPVALSMDQVVVDQLDGYRAFALRNLDMLAASEGPRTRRVTACVIGEVQHGMACRVPPWLRNSLTMTAP